MRNFRNQGLRLGVAFVAFLVFVVTCTCGVARGGAEEALYESRLDEGLSTTEPYSYLLLAQANQSRAQARDLIEKARRYSPDLPAVYFAMAQEAVRPSPDSILQGLDHFREGIRAYGRNVWWAHSLAGLAAVSPFISFLLSLLIVLIIRSAVDAGLVVHEAMEEKRRILLLVIPLGLSLLGPVALAAGGFFLLGSYFRKGDRVLVYASLLFFAASPFLIKQMLPLLSTSSSLRAVVAVNEGKDNRYALWALKGRSDYPSAFSYALALKREGHFQEAIAAYRDLAGRLANPDPKVLINLGNAYYGIKDVEAAKEAYQKSLGVSPYPSAYYNLSQLYREMLDFTKGDEYFQGAAALSPEAVTKFTSVSGTNPNRFVADETLSFSRLWGYAMEGGTRGLSGTDMLVLFLGVAMIAGFYLLGGALKYRAQRCKRCGAVFCSRCSRTVAWGEMCSRCFNSFVKIDESDSRERVARLLSIYHIQSRRRSIARILSYLIPGAGHVYSGKILAGFFFLWVFVFGLAVIVMNSLHPLFAVFPFTQGWITPFMVIAMIASYTASVLHLRRRIHKGWL